MRLRDPGRAVAPTGVAPATRPQRGAVSAETAVVLPVLAVVTLALAWCLAVVAWHVQALDGAREAARAVARGESDQRAVSLARRVAPAARDVRVDVAGDLVTVTVRVPAVPTGVLRTLLPAAEVTGSATALLEEQP